jgi:hypothetical protein
LQKETSLQTQKMQKKNSVAEKEQNEALQA